MILPVLESFTFNEWRLTTNEIITKVGDLLTLQTTNQTSIVGALNELDDAVNGRFGIAFETDFDAQHPLKITRINATVSGPNNTWGATILQRTAKGTIAVPTAPVSGTILGGLDVQAYSGTEWATSARIIPLTTSNWTPTSHHTGWQIWVTDLNSINSAISAQFYGSTRVRIGTGNDDGVNQLQVAGSFIASSIQGTPIGSSTAASGVFTTVNATTFTGSGSGLTAGSVANVSLTNSALTIGSTSVSLGATVTTFAGLVSVTSTTLIGALTGNASTATTLQTTRAINGVNFNGSAAITVPVNTTDDVATATSVYPTFVPTSAASNQSIKTSSTKLTFVPSTGILTATGFVGNGASLTALNAGNVSTGTLAVLRGGTGTTTSTGTGNVVLSASPTLTGIPVAPTAATADTSTQIATTAFVKAVITAGAAAGANYGGDVAIAPVAASALLHLNKPSGVYSAAIKFEEVGVSKYVLGYSGIGSAGATDFSLQNLVPVTPANVLTIFGATSNVAIGGTVDNGYKLDITGTARVSSNLTVDGSLTVNGTLTTINSTQIQVDDINIELGAVASPTDTTANGGGITLLGTTNKTISWSATNGWSSSEIFNLVTGKDYRINGNIVLNATTLGSGILNSSLQTLGTISSGTWNASVITGQYGGTGVANTGKTITLGGNLITSGAFQTTLTSTATTSLTLPTTGTLSTLAGAETLTNKTISGANNTLSAIGNASLTNSTVTLGSTSVALGATVTTFTGLSISGATNTLSAIANSSLTNSAVTLGTTSVALGATSTSIAGLTSISSTMFSGFISPIVANSSYILSSGAAITSLANSPIPKILWHDRFAFSKAFGVPTFETFNGTIWSAATLDAGLFAQQENRASTQIDGTGSTAARWTWNNAQAQYSAIECIILGITHTATSSTKDILYESSADGITWTSRHTSTANNANAQGIVIPVTSNNADAWLRLTITVTNSQPLVMSTIRALSSRWGNQGGGSEQEYPYQWAADQKIAFGTSAVAANGIVTIGTNTSTSADGLWFGTDVNLYRSTANVLKTDDALVSASTITSTDFLIAGTSVLNATTLGSGILYSSLQTVGTISTGVWAASTITINKGGTGAITSGDALTNLLPTGTTSGYVLKTSGPGGFYWAAETGGSPATGTRIDSTRTTVTATAGQTVFTAPTYVPGANQARVYINGIRQFGSEYVETDATTITLNAPGATLNDVVLIEVDGYIVYNMTAAATTFTPTGGIAATNVQTALAELDTEKAPLASPAFTTQISVGGSVIKPSASTYGAISIDGTKGGWNGINFRSGATNAGTFMASSASAGWYNATDNGWSVSWDNAGNFTAAGNVTAYSDERLKTNVQTLTGSLARVCQMRGVEYDRDGIHNIGVIAQEMQRIRPEVVHTGNDEMKTLSVAYGNIVAELIEAIKELKLEIDVLKGVK